MAPIRPSGRKPRASLRARAKQSTKNQPKLAAPPQLSHNDAILDAREEAITDSVARDDVFGEDFRGNKRDKRTIRHNQLLAKVQAGAVRKRPLKRRRPAKKDLANGMDGLMEALPAVQSAASEDGHFEIDDGSADYEIAGLRKGHRASTKMVMKSLRSRPGAMKKRDKLESGERDRFAKNLAGLLAPGSDSTNNEVKPTTQTNRWEALRAFIGSTMETTKTVANKTS